MEAREVQIVTTFGTAWQGHEHKPSSHAGPLDDNREDRRSPEDISADEYRDRKQPINP
jgi:hypothetical protein